MTDETPSPTTPEPPTPSPGQRPRRPLSSADTHARRPDYRGAELDPERGPGLGCFWFQAIVLGFFIVLIPIGLNLNWPFELLAILLFVVLGLLLLTGQTVIFLLRLVAADRRAQGRRRPLASATKTVGELEDEHRVAHAEGGARQARAGVPAAAVPAAADPHAPADVPAHADVPDEAAGPPAGAPPAIGAPAPQAITRGEEVLGTPAAGDLGISSEGEPTGGPDPAGAALAALADAAPVADPDGAAEGAPAGEESAAGEPPEEPDPGVRQ